MPDTIAAVATGAQVAAIGIVRLSGPGAHVIADALFRPASGKRMGTYEDRKLVYGGLYGADGALLDLCMCTLSHGPNSYTGEDTAEFQCHGSPTLLRAVLEECFRLGARQALAGEEELSTEDWKKILDRCRAAGIPQVTFTGGEPTMREDLVELIRYARWFVSRLNTNGIRLTKEYCRALREAELDSVQITFYSSDQAVHERLVGAPRYAETVAAIDNALAEGLSVSINTPLCTLNRNYLDTLAFLHEKGVLYVTCSGLITTGNAAGEASERLQLDGGELERILREAVAYCHENGMEIAFTSPGWIDSSVFEELNIPSPSCGACLSNMAVTPGGNVVPCQSWLSDEPLGNMLKDDWQSIWESGPCAARRGQSAEMTGECPLRRYC